MRLYIEGHSHRLGYAISRTWSDAECSTLPPASECEMKPVRYLQDRAAAFRLVERFNRMAALAEAKGGHK